MILHPAQSRIARSRKRFRVVCCGRRFGKTLLSIYEMAGKAYAKGNRKVVYIAPTYQQARDIVWGQLVEVLKPITVKVNETRLEITVQTVEAGKRSQISLHGWESVEALRGQAFDFIVVDEIASMRNWESSWNTIIRPTLTDRKGEVLFISTPKGFNHFYELYNMSAKDDDFEAFHYTTYDNPHIPRDEVDKARKELSDDQFAQEYLADFRKQEGLVYKEFDRSKHIYSGEIPRRVEFRMAGVDFGFTNPACVLHIAKDSDSHYYVEKELYRTGMTDAHVADYVKAQQFNFVYPDPENPAAIKELEERSVNVREVRKGKDSIVNGISRVRELFKQGRLHIHELCSNTIMELESYHYPEHKDNHNDRENPQKDGDHACFTADTLVSFPMGSVLSMRSTGVKDVYWFMGSKVTADHPYLTQRGFVSLDSIRYSDKIVLWTKSLLMELPLDGIPIPHAVSFGTILSLLKRNVLAIKQNVSTGIYGKNIMGKFLRKCTSITGMVIRLITIYLISNLSLRSNTIRGIILRCSRNGGRKQIRLGDLLPGGMGAKRATNSTGNLENSRGKTIDMALLTASSVDFGIKPRSPGEPNSVPIIAKLERSEPEEVFAVATSSGFFAANGVIVSNCDALRYVIMTDDSVIMDDVDFNLYATKYK